MNANLSILQRNVIASFENEEAIAAFLRAQDQPQDDSMSYWAEDLARDTDRICLFLKLAIDAAAKPFEANNEVQSDLLDFILKRHWHTRVNA